MPKLGCVCGYVHNLSPIPDHGYRTILDRDFDEHWDDLGAAFREDRMASARCRNLWGLLYECPECGRLTWFRNGSDVAESFVPERGAAGSEATDSPPQRGDRE